jgi:16S rRNA G1207 methylase RsmC
MTEHYFSEKQRGRFQREFFAEQILGNDIRINSGSGIFSYAEIDFGTRLLIENAQVPAKGALLDLGCGYGVVGIAVKKAHPEIEICMIDINERAVKLAKENCEQNNISATILKSDIFSNPGLTDKIFDTILTNPPFSAGKKICMEFIKQSHAHLNKNGSLQLVAPHNKGGESLKKYMVEIFGNAGELVKKRGYRVYISVKK